MIMPQKKAAFRPKLWHAVSEKNKPAVIFGDKKTA